MDEGKQYKNSEVTFIPRTLNKNAVEREAVRCSGSPSPNLGILQTWAGEITLLPRQYKLQLK